MQKVARIGGQDMAGYAKHTNPYWTARIFWNAQAALCRLISLMISDIAADRQPRAIVTTFNGLGSLLSDSEWQSERSSQAPNEAPTEYRAPSTLDLFAQSKAAIVFKNQTTAVTPLCCESVRL